MATTIEQQVALDEALVPSAQRLRIGRSSFRLPSDIQSKEPTLQVVYDVLRRSPFFRAFLVTADVPKIYIQEFWATAKEILEFLRFLGHSAQIKTLTDVNVNKLYQPWRSFATVINKCLTGKSNGFDSLRDDILFFTIKVVSRHQNTQQYGAILPIELTTEDIRNTKAYKKYYACATGEAAPKPKASARKKKGKQLARARSHTEPLDVERKEAKQLKIVLRRSKHETHISQQGSSSTDEGTDSRPGVPNVPSDDSEEELSWNSFDDEDVDDQTKGSDDNEGEKTDESDDDD
nr:hypothetical protein [Tanacetum cinerariifolium]